MPPSRPSLFRADSGPGGPAVMTCAAGTQKDAFRCPATDHSKAPNGFTTVAQQTPDSLPAGAARRRRQGLQRTGCPETPEKRRRPQRPQAGERVKRWNRRLFYARGVMRMFGGALCSRLCRGTRRKCDGRDADRPPPSEGTESARHDESGMRARHNKETGEALPGAAQHAQNSRQKKKGSCFASITP